MSELVDQRTHLTDTGPQPCTADTRACPVKFNGGRALHFSTEKEAEAAWHKHLVNKHGLFHTSRKGRKNPHVLTADEFAKSSVAEEIRQHKSDDAYKDSQFYGLKTMSSRSKGAYMEKMVESVLANHFGLEVKRASGTSDHDRMVNGHAVEIKGSFMWDQTENFKWQQIRPKQQYGYLVFLAVYPDRSELWAATKEECDEYVLAKDDKGRYKHAQHGGKGGDSMTFIISGLW